MNSTQKKKWGKAMIRAKELRKEAEERNAKVIEEFKELSEIYRRQLRIM